MSTKKQIDANRRNAQHSTGPQTEAGKRISSRNAFKHGLAAKEFCINGEDPDHYDEAFADLVDEYAAHSTGDKFLIEQILQSTVLAQRARYHLFEYFFVAERGNQPALPGYNDNQPQRPRPGSSRYIDFVALIVRYLTQHERSVIRANDMFHKNRRLLKQDAPSAAADAAPLRSQEPSEPTTSLDFGFVPQNRQPGVRQLLKLTRPAPKPLPIA